MLQKNTEFLGTFEKRECLIGVGDFEKPLFFPPVLKEISS
jgi:hypothetical protein